MRAHTLANSGAAAAAANCSFSQYSTAFTSWLVVLSMVFTRCACSTEKEFTMSWRACSAVGDSSATSGMACKPRSTQTRHI